MPIRVLIVDDHEVVREGILKMLSLDPEIEVVGKAQNGQEALYLAEKLKPQVVITDFKLPDLTGSVVTKALRNRIPDILVIILTAYDDEQYLLQSLEAGAMAYLLKDTSAENLIGTVKRVTEGEEILTPEIASMALQEKSPVQKRVVWNEFTPRELEVLSLMVKGYSNNEIATTLYLSNNTVKTHVRRIFRKLGVESRAEAISLAYRKKLVE